MLSYIVSKYWRYLIIYMEEKIDWEEYNALYAEIDINQIIPGMYVSSFYAAESEKRLKVSN